MNIVLRKTFLRSSLRLTDSILYKNLPKNILITSTCPIAQTRSYCEDRTLDTKRLPPLMDFPPVVWPSFIKFIKNWIFAAFIIRPYFDQEFSLREFVDASKHAVQIVSESLQSSDWNSLEGLVEKDTLITLKNAVSKLSVSQRQMLTICKDDIFYSFPYQVGVIFDEADKRWVEITMVYHVMRGFKELQEKGELPVFNVNDHDSPEYDDKIFILNYRFIREFTKGVEDSWCINIANHLQPKVIREIREGRF